MPRIYLSPSTQEFNPYIIPGNEELYMNRIADAMEPFLRSSGIAYTRNDPEKNYLAAVEESNRGSYDLHLALHSNAAPEALAGQLSGTDVYYYPTSTRGRQAAEILADNLRAIVPDPAKVQTRPTTTIAEVRRTKAPAVLIEYAYHDNEEEARWITDNIDRIAETTVIALTEFCDIPFLTPQPETPGFVNAPAGFVNLRERPSVEAPILTTIENGEALTILNRWEDWYLVDYYGVLGYVYAAYVTTL